MSVYYKLGLFLIFILSSRLFHTRAAPLAGLSVSHNYTNEDYPDNYVYDDDDDENENDEATVDATTKAATTSNSRNSITFSFFPTIELPKRSNHVVEPSCPHACRCFNDYKDIYCSNAELTAVPSDLPSTVVTLDLSHNRLTTLRPNDFTNCTRLRELNLSYNQITDLDEQMFASTKRLQSLRLSNNLLKRLAPNVFNSLSTLQLLDISNNSLELPQNAEFLNQASLVELYCRNCSWTQLYDETFVNLSSLRALTLDQNDFSKKINTKAFAPLPKLIKLKLPDLEKSYVQQLCAALNAIDTISFYHFNISCYMLVLEPNSFDESLTVFTESPFKELEVNTNRLPTTLQNVKMPTDVSANMTNENFVLLNANETAFTNDSNGGDVETKNITNAVLQQANIGGAISKNGSSGDAEEQTYQVPISREVINILLFVIMITAIVGIVIGILCRKDIGGIKTKCCRTRKPIPKNTTQQTAEEIPLK